MRTCPAGATDTTEGGVRALWGSPVFGLAPHRLYEVSIRTEESVSARDLEDGDLRLITTLTSFATAPDVTLAELHLEAFLPADESTADVLRSRLA